MFTSLVLKVLALKRSIYGCLRTARYLNVGEKKVEDQSHHTPLLSLSKDGPKQ